MGPQRNTGNNFCVCIGSMSQHSTAHVVFFPANVTGFGASIAVFFLIFFISNTFEASIKPDLRSLTPRKDPKLKASRKGEVELSHFLLLRMCRAMDLWQRGLRAMKGKGAGRLLDSKG